MNLKSRSGTGRGWIAAVSTALAICGSGGAFASGPLSVTSSVLVEQRSAATDGTTAVRLVAPKRVTPGDQVTLVLDYRNTAAKPIADVVLVNRVPAGMVFRAAAPTPLPEYSVDGSAFASIDRLRVRTADGAQRPATPGDVVAVRWRLPDPVAPGASGRVTFRAVLK